VGRSRRIKMEESESVKVVVGLVSTVLGPGEFYIETKGDRIIVNVTDKVRFLTAAAKLHGVPGWPSNAELFYQSNPPDSVPDFPGPPAK
jgi:hypothetical protein